MTTVDEADPGEARPEKVAVVREVAELLSVSTATLLADYRGLSVGEFSQLRARLREAEAGCRVVKNTLARRAADEAGVEGLGELLVGPTALVFCDDGPVGPAKALTSFADQHPELTLKGGFFEGEVLDEEAAAHLATLQSRDELLQRMAQLLGNTMAGIARLMQAKVTDFGRLMRALEDQRGEASATGEAASGTAEAAGAGAEETEPEPGDETDEAEAATEEDDTDEAGEEATTEADDEAETDGPDSEDS